MRCRQAGSNLAHFPVPLFLRNVDLVETLLNLKLGLGLVRYLGYLYVPAHLPVPLFLRDVDLVQYLEQFYISQRLFFLRNVVDLVRAVATTHRTSGKMLRTGPPGCRSGPSALPPGSACE